VPPLSLPPTLTPPNTIPVLAPSPPLPLLAPSPPFYTLPPSQMVPPILPLACSPFADHGDPLTVSPFNPPFFPPIPILQFGARGVGRHLSSNQMDDSVPPRRDDLCLSAFYSTSAKFHHAPFRSPLGLDCGFAGWRDAPALAALNSVARTFRSPSHPPT